jgi:hypothetical protein
MKVLIQARSIPVGSTVTKKTGDKPYTLRDDVKIYGSTQEQTEALRELKADEGTRFLISQTGDISIISGDVELLWHVTEEVLYQYLYMRTQLDNK